MNTAKRFAGMRNARLGGRPRIEPSALDAGEDAVIAGNGTDQCGQPARAGAVAVEQFGMKAQRREGAMREPAGVEICLGVGAADGAAAPPKAAGRFGGVVAVPLVRAWRSRQCEEGAGFIERGAQRRRTGTVADEIEQIAMLPCRRVGLMLNCT